MAGKLAGKVALVTGASSGIGEATAIALAAEGAAVAIVARRGDRLTALKAKIEASGGTALSLVADVTDEGQIRAAIDRTAAELGRLDILVNNAGVMLLGHVGDADTEDWRRMVNLNVLGLMYATHAALPHLKKQTEGASIVNVSSTAGRVTNSFASVYSATKFAVGAFSEGLRQELVKEHIRVTIIEPGMVATELREHTTNAAVKEQIEKMAASMRQLQSEDIAAAIVYATTQPPHVNVNEILIRPMDQER
jgi:NADP-dependent 3-hydroxy acid dehydrogenase YdfG